MNDVLHYMLHPSMPLPKDMTEALDLPLHLPHTWQSLTDSERIQLFRMYPPVVAIATFNHTETFVAVAVTAQDATTALERAWNAHLDEHGRCCGIDRDYPVTDETSVVTGALGTVWRDGSCYPKGNR